MRAAIAGVGAAGIFVLSRLADSPDAIHAGSELYLVDDPNTFGRGRAFGADVDAASINTSHSRLNTLSPSFHAFADWSRSNGTEVADLDVHPMPRSTYGDYLVSTLSRALQILRRRGMRVHYVPGQVTRIDLDSPQVEVGLGSDRLSGLDLLVSATGTWSKGPYKIATAHTYVHDPYPLACSVRRLASHKSVAVLGAGLTAVDIACALDGSDTTVHLISRSGKLPRVQVDAVSQKYSARLLTEESIESLRRANELTAASVLDLVDAEMAYFGNGLDMLSDSSELARHWDWPLGDPSDLACHNALSATNHALNTAFGALPQTERNVLRSVLGVDWFRYRVRIPLARWRQVRKMMSEGRLVLHSGVDARSSELSAVFDELNASCLVNATGPSADLGESGSALAELAASGRIGQDEAGRGLSDPLTGHAIRADGAPERRLFLLGQPTAGSHFMVSALDVIHRQANRVAAALSQEMGAHVLDEVLT